MIKLIQGDCLEIMPEIESGSVDLTVTSPPYDNLRNYNNSLVWCEHIWKPVIKELYRVTKKGGVVVWVAGDATIKGSESGTSFKQALHFKEIGFNLHDTMIYHKPNAMPLTHNRYDPAFEYMFIFSKGRLKTFNPIKIKTINPGLVKKRELETKSNIDKNSQSRQRNEHTVCKKEKYLKNVWSYNVGVEPDRKMNNHPAIFPEKLANDHIISWSNPGDLVFDPMCGSGTTGKVAKINGRSFIGIEKNPEYFKIAQERIGGNDRH